MQCVNGHFNPDGQRFCGTCGAAAVMTQTPPPYQGPVGFTPQAPSGLVEVAGVGAFQVASFGRRLSARLIDLLLIWVVWIALVFIADLWDGWVASVVIIPIWLMIWLLYEWLFIAYVGATVGKAALGIMVIDQRNGRLLGAGPAFVRQLMPVVGSVFFLLGTLLVYVSPLFDSSGRLQGWHDKAANDLVVVKR